VIGVCGRGDPANGSDRTAAATAAGMDACLAKPVSPRTLADVLARVRGEAIAGV
jgi:CheY-like chemotaxis protein